VERVIIKYLTKINKNINHFVFENARTDSLVFLLLDRVGGHDGLFGIFRFYLINSISNAPDQQGAASSPGLVYTLTRASRSGGESVPRHDSRK
jgi:hypothetical protein